MPYTGCDPLLFLEGMVENLPWVSWESAEWGSSLSGPSSMATACSCSAKALVQGRTTSASSPVSARVTCSKQQAATCLVMQIWIVNVGPDHCGALAFPLLLPEDF